MRPTRYNMKRTNISIPWQEGLHARPAAKLVKNAQPFKSSICLKIGEKMADARSILALLLLSASFGTVVELEVSGIDEEQAFASVASVFDLDAIQNIETEIEVNRRG